MRNIEFIRAIGIDKCPGDNEKVKLTIATQRIESEGESATQQKQTEILHSEGSTVFEAIRRYWSYVDKKPFWGHLEYIIVGEEAAKEGLLRYIDFFIRDPELRLNAKVFATKGFSAEEIMKSGSGRNKFIFDRLKGISENMWGRSISMEVDLVEVVYILERDYLSLYVPCIEVAKLTEEIQGEQQEYPMNVVIKGFAVFHDDKLVLHLDEKKARGLSWLRNKMHSGVITVKSPEGNNISLEIINTNTRLKPEIKNGELSLTVEVKVSTNINEVGSFENIFTKQAISYLEKKQEEFIKDEIESTIKVAQENNLDFFSIGDVFYSKYPIVWEDKYRKDWESYFSNIEFNIVVNSKIIMTYDIK